MSALVIHRHAVGEGREALHVAVVGDLPIGVRAEQIDCTVLPIGVIRLTGGCGVGIDVLEAASAVIEPGVARPSPVVDEVAVDVLLVAILAPLVTEFDHLLLPHAEPGDGFRHQLRLFGSSRRRQNGELVRAALSLAVGLQGEGDGILAGRGVGLSAKPEGQVADIVVEIFAVSEISPAVQGLLINIDTVLV